MKKVCIFGASITSGYLDEENGGWCDLLKRDLLKKGYFVFNLGISGDDSRGLLERFDRECEPRDPDLIIISAMGNDSQYFINEEAFRIDLEETIANFEKIFTLARKYTKKIAVTGLTKVEEEKINADFIKRKNKYYKNEDSKKYDRAIQRLAQEKSIPFLDLFELLEDQQLVDGLHPNSQGHEKIFQKVKSFLEKEGLINLK